MIPARGGVDDASDFGPCRRCRGKLRERNGKDCARCKGTGDEPDVRRSTPCPNCHATLPFHVTPEYEQDARTTYAVCQACGRDYQVTYQHGVMQRVEPAPD